VNQNISYLNYIFYFFRKINIANKYICMRKISQNEKKEVSGGIGPMIL
jgi:hypothetical protein